MKLIKIFIVLGIILLLPTNNANSQIVTGIQTVHIRFSPNHYILVPCLEEEICGDITEEYFITHSTYHAKGQGELIGVSGDLYTVNYVFNASWTSLIESFPSFVMPMELKHEGKIIAVIHLVKRIVINGNGEEVQHIIYDAVNCNCN